MFSKLLFAEDLLNQQAGKCQTVTYKHLAREFQPRARLTFRRAGAEHNVQHQGEGISTPTAESEVNNYKQSITYNISEMA